MSVNKSERSLISRSAKNPPDLGRFQKSAVGRRSRWCQIGDARPVAADAPAGLGGGCILSGSALGGGAP
jgi:hypothetical protein